MRCRVCGNKLIPERGCKNFEAGTPTPKQSELREGWWYVDHHGAKFLMNEWNRVGRTYRLATLDDLAYEWDGNRVWFNMSSNSGSIYINWKGFGRGFDLMPHAYFAEHICKKLGIPVIPDAQWEALQSG